MLFNLLYDNFYFLSTIIFQMDLPAKPQKIVPEFSEKSKQIY
jgi:hypothetical protein